MALKLPKIKNIFPKQTAEVINGRIKQIGAFDSAHYVKYGGTTISSTEWVSDDNDDGYFLIGVDYAELVHYGGEVAFLNPLIAAFDATAINNPFVSIQLNYQFKLLRDFGGATIYLGLYVNDLKRVDLLEGYTGVAKTISGTYTLTTAEKADSTLKVEIKGYQTGGNQDDYYLEDTAGNNWIKVEQVFDVQTITPTILKVDKLYLKTITLPDNAIVELSDDAAQRIMNKTGAELIIDYQNAVEVSKIYFHTGNSEVSLCGNTG